MMLSLIYLLLQIQVVDHGPEHYRVINTHNLFRPLGWTPPQRDKGVLLGTVLHNGEEIAYVKSRRNINLLRVGDSLDGSRVKEISSRKVTLENGDTYEQKSVEFLGDEKGRSGRSDRRSGRGVSNSEGKVSEGDRPKRRTNESARASGRNFQRSFSEAERKEWREARKKFQDASPEERVRMIEEFRGRRGGRQ